jgi:hypothetical protein
MKASRHENDYDEREAEAQTNNSPSGENLSCDGVAHPQPQGNEWTSGAATLGCKNSRFRICGSISAFHIPSGGF